jgi:hypothetical protein
MRRYLAPTREPPQGTARASLVLRCDLARRVPSATSREPIALRPGLVLYRSTRPSRRWVGAGEGSHAAPPQARRA